VEVPGLRSAANLLPSGSARNIAGAWGQGPKDRIEVPDNVGFAADHHAIAPFQSPDPAAGPHIHVVNSFGPKLRSSPDVVDVIGVPAVDENIAGFEIGRQICNRAIDHGRRNHQPDGSRLFQLLDQILQAGGARRLLSHKLFHRFRRKVEDHGLLALFQKAPNHIGAHAAQADHSQLHIPSLLRYPEMSLRLR
jgi:hypothetical protein